METNEVAALRAELATQREWLLKLSVTLDCASSMQEVLQVAMAELIAAAPPGARGDTAQRIADRWRSDRNARLAAGADRHPDADAAALRLLAFLAAAARPPGAG